MSADAVWTLALADAGFPACLAQLELPAAEPVYRLYGTGERERLLGFDHDRTVTIVGARRASAYGKRFAIELGRELALAGVQVVSGLARGIDAAAHRGALLGGGAPLAVVANGPDVIYPPMNGRLREEVLAAGGTIVSEYPAGTEARKHQFRDRNRIMAALGKVVVIVEAAQPSGSLITADAALRIGREVGAVPGQVGNRMAQGTNALLQEGAAVVRHATDVLDLLLDIDHERREPIGAAIEPHLREVLALVEGGASTVDDVALAGALDPREAAVALAHLELLGYLLADAGGCFRRAPLLAPSPEEAQID